VPVEVWTQPRPVGTNCHYTAAKAKAKEMSGTDSESGLVSGRADALSDLAPTASSGAAGRASGGQADLAAAGMEESLGRMATLAATALSAPSASVMFAGTRSLPGMRAALGIGGQQTLFERSLCAVVVGSEDKLIIGDTRVDTRMSDSNLPGPVGMIAWAGVPVRDQEGHVAGVLWVADQVPRQWSVSHVAVLENLARVASGEVALRGELARSAGRAALAQMLEESLLPPRAPDIPGLQVAARYAAGGTGAEVLGDFCDVFPSLRGSWGMVVGDVCGKGPEAAKGTALARYALRAVARRQTRPSLILADLNQVLLDWPTEDPRFLTAIYAAVRLVDGGAMVRISSAGHPLALVRAANGHVHEFGRPGALLGVLAHPELHDSRRLLRAGDSLILFSDGVTEARSGADRAVYGDERLRSLVARLGDLTAVAMAEAVQLAVLTFGGGRLSDDTVALVMKVPAALDVQAPVRGRKPLCSSAVPRPACRNAHARVAADSPSAGGWYMLVLAKLYVGGGTR
jgi:sigma-B regulation protein RsbU (phosphoserine phosphatase)